MSYISIDQKLAFSESFTFDDLLLLPQKTDFDRSQIDLNLSLSPKINLSLPVLSSPMDTVTETDSAICIAKNGGMGIIHRNLSIQEQSEMVRQVKNAEGGDSFPAVVDEHGRLLVGAAVGAVNDMQDRVKALVEAEADMIVIDTAHGHTQLIIDAIKSIKQNYPDLPIMAGNITTQEAAIDLIEAGADILRVGMGPGSICTTRIVTGIGVPQLTAIENVAKIARPKGVKVVADGGIKQIGDIAKALAMGADCVMLGSMLAGFEESPGEKVEFKDKFYKRYRGMGSEKAMRAGAASRYGQNFDAKKLVAEGVEALVPFKGKMEDFLYQIRGGLTSSLYYCGSRYLGEFYQKSRFIKISNAGIKESHPHSIVIEKSGESYLG